MYLTPEEVIEKHRRLAYHVVRRFRQDHPLGRRLRKEDAQQEALIALMNAGQHYDAERVSKAKFSTYAYKAIWCKLIQATRQELLIRIPDQAAVKKRRRLPKVYLCGLQHDEHLEDRRLEWPDRIAARKDEQEAQLLRLQEGMRFLPIRLQMALNCRYGLQGYTAGTLDQVGQQLGVTTERARQLIIKAELKLYARLSTTTVLAAGKCRLTPV